VDLDEIAYVPTTGVRRFWCDGAKGLYIHPNVWHGAFVPHADQARFLDRQGRCMRACQSTSRKSSAATSPYRSGVRNITFEQPV
jgi:ureidoglycolate hydrolase